LLLDARGLQPTFNGTSQCALGVCDGLYELGTDWDIGVWCDAPAAAFYGLKQRYPRWSLFTERPGRKFGTALRLSQPWAISELTALHDLALFNVHLFLDTIAWDVVYAAPPHLDTVWRFAAAGADGLCFISRYSLERFQSRFLRDRDVPTEVCLLSCDPRDYARPASRSVLTGAAHILVMGNDYDHKAVRPTVELLATAFPYQSFVAFAAVPSVVSRIRPIPSGALSDEEVGELYASTRLLVFPSHYEGFGFPVLTALAYGRTVLARRSALLDEVASHYRGPGELVEYGSPLELIERAGSILHGLAYPTKPLGSALGSALAWRWTDTAQRLVGFLERVSLDPSRSRWEYRSQALAQIAAAGSSS
jgi:glycosyltransferase involved in cell wall biosynthesis